MMDYLLLGVVTLTLYASCHAQSHVVETWYAKEYPHPQKEPAKCRTTGVVSHICDPNSLLSMEEVKKLDLQIQRIRNGTTCPCSRYYCKQNPMGYHIGLALVKGILSDSDRTSRGGPHSRTGSGNQDVNEKLKRAKTFAEALRKKWNFGNCEEDVIILYSSGDHVVYTRAGNTARQVLTDNICGQITLDNLGYFRQNGEIFKGLSKIISDYELVFRNKYERYTVVAPHNPEAIHGNSAGLLQLFTSLLSVTLVLTLLQI